MSIRTDKMKLGVFVYPTGHHMAGWRHPEGQADSAIDLRHYVEVARTAERGKFDMVFFADTLGARDAADPQAWQYKPTYTSQFEPISLLSALATATDRIGLVATATTTYNQPFQIARQFASLDYLSNGRAGWNLVTSSAPDEAFNFGHDRHPEHGLRYRRAREFAQVVKGLWDTWEDDAFLRDATSGRYFDPEKFHLLNHKGEFFQVRGPLNVGRPVQGYPVMVQAGSSDDGRDLAAETAEVVFTAQPDLEAARSFYSDLKARVVARGRDADSLKILPGIMPIVGRTREEAQEKYDHLQSLIHPRLGLTLLSDMLGGIDLSGYDLDAPFPLDLPESNGGKSRHELIRNMAVEKGYTLRQTYLAIAGARGHWTVCGTPADIADQMAERFYARGCDGFNVMPAYLPGSLREFVDDVVPVLQERGLFRTEYEGTTLRDSLGLSRPAHPQAVARAAADQKAVQN